MTFPPKLSRHDSKIIHTQGGNLEGEALEYIEAVSPMPNEVDLVLQIQLLLDQNIRDFFTQNNTKAEVIYYCCGPAPFLYDLKEKNHSKYKLLSTSSNIIGIDLNKAFIHFNQQTFPEFTWQKADAITFKKSNQISVLNSSYHHIPDAKKQDFLTNISANLAEDGVVIMGENFLPYYSPDESD